MAVKKHKQADHFRIPQSKDLGVFLGVGSPLGPEVLLQVRLSGSPARASALINVNV